MQSVFSGSTRLPNVGNTCYMHSGIQLLRRLKLNGHSMTTILANVSEDGMTLTDDGKSYPYLDDHSEYRKKTKAIWLQLLNPKLTFDFHSLREMFKTILESHQSSRHKVGEMGDPLQFIQGFFLEMFLPFETFRHVRIEHKVTGVFMASRLRLVKMTSGLFLVLLNVIGEVIVHQLKN